MTSTESNEMMYLNQEVFNAWVTILTSLIPGHSTQHSLTFWETVLFHKPKNKNATHMFTTHS